jgi:hypothetical protein
MVNICKENHDNPFPHFFPPHRKMWRTQAKTTKMMEHDN